MKSCFWFIILNHDYLERTCGSSTTGRCYGIMFIQIFQKKLVLINLNLLANIWLNDIVKSHRNEKLRPALTC